MTPDPPGGSDSSRYEFRVAGHLDLRWQAWFDDLALTHEPDDTTTLRGALPDQSALHGVLGRLRDLGLTLISVRTLNLPSDPSPPPGRSPRRRDA